jgi:protein-tyrosine-phosphatase
MAEGLMRKAIEGRTDLTTSSAGVAASKGTPASKETVQILKKREASLTDFRSQPVTAAVLKKASHVFAMTEGHLAALESRFPEYADKYYLVGEFSGVTDKRYGIDVPDPIGMGAAAYEEVAKVFESAIPTIIAYLDAEAE